ncbi:DUF192 domain-containing protein [Patescibacteria group bacterium]|nr:DUF192 domain-containing protein [Patescibacteria group bacterium]
MKVPIGILAVLVLVAGGLFVLEKNQTSVPVVDTRTPQASNNDSMTDEEKVIADWYAPLTPFTFGRISMQASIADTDAERAQGLSGTPYIPIGIAKVFIFDTSEKWSFWMKDMNYPIDIFWLDENGYVVHVIENASPDTYPEISFIPPVPAKYVIETKAGFAAENNISMGTIANIDPLERAR